MTRRLAVVPLLLLSLVLTFGAAAVERPGVVPPSADVLARDGARLADPRMEGRASGTAGAERAAQDIARELEAAGLRPGGDGGTFFQSFVITSGIRLAPTSRFDLPGPGGRRLELDREWRPHGGSRRGEVTGEMVFVGYGITLVRFAGEPVNGLEELRRVLKGKKPGDSVELVYLRNGEDRTASAALDASP